MACQGCREAAEVDVTARVDRIERAQGNLAWVVVSIGVIVWLMWNQRAKED